MGGEVYANGREVSCKAGSNNVIAAFPDVCLSPPSPPAGPIPIPYPVSSSSSDASDGSTSVTVGGQEVMLKDKSYYKKCTGDEAATKTLGQGVVNASLSGKVYFVSWSMDVLFEGENVVRHLDMTTSNHASPMPNEALTIPGIENMDPEVLRDCDKVYAKYKLRRHGSSKSCTDTVGKAGYQSHHPAQNACFEASRGVPFVSGYNTLDAPAICLETAGPDSPHKLVNAAQRDWAKGRTTPPKLSEVRAAGKDQLVKKGGLTESEAECIMKVVDEYMKASAITETSKLRLPYS
jgi:hypothetical protein